MLCKRVVEKSRIIKEERSVMYILECWIEHPLRTLDHTFTYLSDEEVSAGCRVSVDFNRHELVGFVESVEESNRSQEEISLQRGMTIQKIKGVIDDGPLITSELHELALHMRKTTLSTTISCFQCILPPKIRPSSSAKQIVTERYVRISDNAAELTPKQTAAYLVVKEKGEMRYSDLRKAYPSLAKKMVDNGSLVCFTKEKEAPSTVHGTMEKPPMLREAQKEALERIEAMQKRAVLLRGVTGSGKTEIYLQLAAKVLQRNKQVLILVPEIALTPQMIERVTRRFGEELAIYHSGLNAQEKYEQYIKVKSCRARIVVGTRSAVFLPFSSLGLIVMDEEHDGSYKQDKQPSYHCRDIALWRADYHGASLLLGSATPSLDSYARALKGVYGLVELDERINQSLPLITVVPMKREMERGNTVLSQLLKDKIQDRLIRHEKVILLLNRRGYNSALHCRSCGEVIMCPHCELSMSYHRSIGRLKCHFCGTEMRVPLSCPSCGSIDGFTGSGYGTERLEKEVRELFPEAMIYRMDADTVSRKNAHEKILRQFMENGDILLGTQMIAKGLDFPEVTLVGILAADSGLERSDYRSCEETFDLLMQASGRSGRAEKKGEVIFQVYDTSHYAVQCALRQDYRTFFKMEMNFRHRCMYPPYTYLISLLVQGKDEKKVREASLWLKNGLVGQYKTIGVIILLKRKDMFRARIILKGKDLDEMRKDISTLLDGDDKRRADMVVIDVNPMVLDG